MARSPRKFVYPACNKNRSARAATLGTSVGWSDIYGPGYYQQWIDVTGLRGRFAFVHIADPENGIWESNEGNNEGETLIDLPVGEGDRAAPAHDCRPHGAQRLLTRRGPRRERR